MTDLQTDLDLYPWPTDLTTPMGRIVEAARLVANPNIEAMFDAVHYILWVELGLDISDEATTDLATRIVAAALTPQGDTELGDES